MSNSTEKEYDEIWLPVASSGMVILAGLLVQSFIVAVNFVDWLRGKQMKATDLIITSIGILRIFYHISSLLHMFSSLYSAELYPFWAFLLFIWETSDFSSICLSTLLSIFFCFRISTFHNIFFFHLKAFISRRVVYLIITSVLLGLGFASVYLVLIDVLMKSSEDSILDSDFNKRTRIISIFYFLFNLFPLLMYFASSVLLVIFLGLHMSRLKSSTSVISSTDTYHRAIKFTAVSFLTSASCIIVNVTGLYGVELFGLRWMYFIWNIFPVLYSVCLIYVTTKLRNWLWVVIRFGTDCLFKRKASHPKSGEVVEVIPL